MKWSVVLILVFQLSIQSNAQCIKGNCYSGTGLAKLSDGSRYEGRFHRGKFHGKGTLNFANGDVYVGEFRHHKMNNIGKYTFAKGGSYVGDFKNDKRHGKGKMIFDNGDQYKGEWKEGKMDGDGVYIFANGKELSGKFDNGTFVDINPSVIANNISNSSSENVLLKDCTTAYCHHTNGIYRYGDGSSFTGYFIDGVPNGDGEVSYVNGDRYKGGWKNHSPHGMGTFLQHDGTVISGKFVDGILKERIYNDHAVDFSPAPGSKQKSEKGTKIYAVVVGVATYHHMQSLKYTDDDAYQLYAFLKSPQGGALPDEQVNILIDENATRSNILKSVKDVAFKADEDDVIMIYMSGHGLEGAYVPFDFDGMNNLLAYEELLAVIKSSRAKNKVFITDACHSGSMIAARSGFAQSLESYYDELANTMGGLAVMMSSKKDEVSLEYSGMRQGVFSHYLIRGLKGESNKDGNNFITIRELYVYVSTNVRHYTNQAQSPQIMGTYKDNMPVAMFYEY